MLLAPRVALATDVRLRHEADSGVVCRSDLKLLNYMRRVCPTVILEPLFLSSAVDRAALAAVDYWGNLGRAVADTVDLWEQMGGGLDG